MNIRFPKAFITRAEELDFSDDGNRFRGYKYKNTVPITYLRSTGDIYCSIRLDYKFSYDTYKELMHICHEFNGCAADDFDMNKFISNCEQAYQFIMNYNSVPEKKKRIENELFELENELAKLKNELVHISEKKHTLENELISLT